MKRILSLLIVSILILCGYSGIAETFSVRNGIAFGMSRDEVSRIEEEVNGTTKKAADIYDAENYSFSDGKKIDGRIVYLPDSVAGYDDSPEIQYYFDETDSLNKIIYIWDIRSDYDKTYVAPSEKILEQYKDLVGSLSDKYELIGEMEGDEIKYVDFGNPKYMDTFLDEDSGSLHNWWKYIMRDFSQYLYSFDGGYVSISAYCISQIQSLGAFGSDYVIFEYTYCSPEQVEAKAAEGQAKIDERNSDL